MTTMTKSLDQWLEECPNKLEFYSRFIDVKLDVENIAEVEEITLTDEQLNNVIDRYMNTDWSYNSEAISELIQEELREAN